MRRRRSQTGLVLAGGVVVALTIALVFAIMKLSGR